MAKDNQINVKVNDPTYRAITDFADDRDYTKAEAVRRITESRLQGEGYLTKQFYGSPTEGEEGNEIPARLEPVLRVSDYLANGGTIPLIGGVLLWLGLGLGVIEFTVLSVVSMVVLTVFGFLTILSGVVLFLIAIVYEETMNDWLTDHGRTWSDIRPWVGRVGR